MHSTRNNKKPGTRPGFRMLRECAAYQLVSTEPLNFSSMNFFTSGV